MGRMENQLPDELKKARVDELMRAQQDIAFAKAAKMIGQQIQVIIDRPADSDANQYVARSRSQAPEIDSVTLVHGRKLPVGELLAVKVTDTADYDLIAQPIADKRHRLRVVG
jgi:ribosomal protein S12 methylthiotransferase